MHYRSLFLSVLAAVVFLNPTLAVADTVECDIPGPPEKGSYPAELGIESHDFLGGQLLVRVCEEIGYVDFSPMKHMFAWIDPGGTFHQLRELTYDNSSYAVFGDQGLVVIRHRPYDRYEDLGEHRVELRWSPFLKVLVTSSELTQVERFKKAVSANDPDTMLKVFESLETANIHGDWHHPLFENLARVVTRSASRLRKAGKPSAAIELLDRILPERAFSSSRADDKIDLVFAWGQQLDDTSENLALLEEMADTLTKAPPRPGHQHQLDIGRAGQLLTTAIQVDPGRDEALLRLANLMWNTRKHCKSNSYGSDFFYTRVCHGDEAIKSLYVRYAQAAGDKTKAYVVTRLGFDPSRPRQSAIKRLPAAKPGYAWRTFTPNPAATVVEIRCDENTPSGREFLTRIKARNCSDFRYGNHRFSELKGSVRIPEDMRVVATAEKLTPSILRWSEANKVVLQAACVGGLPEDIVHLQCDPKVAISPVILARLNKLETLEIPKFREKYEPVVEALLKLPKLRTLRINRLREPEVSIPLIASLERLEVLDLQISHEFEDPTVFRHLSKLRALREFRIATHSAVEGLARVLSNLTQLRSLSIHVRTVTEDELWWLAKLESLERLDLQIAFTVKSQGVLALAQLPNLHTLELGKSAISDADMADVAQLSQVRALGVSQTNVTHFGVESIGRMRNLVVLDVSLEWSTNSHIAAPGSAVNPLRNLTQLRHLNARFNTMEGREVAEVVALKQLRSLNLQYTRWTDRSELEVLEKLPNLKVLFAEPSGQLSREKFKEWADSVESFEIVGP